MASVVESIDVKAPVSTVYNQWTQFEEFPRFMEGVKSVTQTDDTHLHWVAEVGRQGEGVGCRDHRAASRRARRLERHRRRRERRRGHLPPDRRRDDAGDAAARADPEGLVENVGTALGFLDRRVKGDLERFKEFIESRGTETGAWRGNVEAPLQR